MSQLPLQLAERCQRWRAGRESYRPKGEVIDPRQYEVAPVPEKDAKAYVIATHYSSSYPAARWRFGLFRAGVLVGVAVFSHPTNDRTLTNVFGGEASESVELGRFVLDQDVKGNGETWFLARCFEQLRPEGLRGVVSFSDPMPRRSVVSGDLVTPGHVGTIYQAFNGIYLGRSTPDYLRLLDSGQILSKRTLQKIRSKERGWEYAVRQLVTAGATQPGPDLRAWLKTELPRVSKAVRHHGNHRFAWAFSKGSRRDLERLHDALPGHLLAYPKQPDPEPSVTRRAV